MAKTTRAGTPVLVVALWTAFSLVAPTQGVVAASGQTQDEAPETRHIEDQARSEDSQAPGSADRGAERIAGPEQGFTLSWWTVDGGGGTSGNGALGLAATFGQPDAGTLSGSDFVLDGGFRMGASMVQAGLIFSDGFETGDTSRWSNQHPSRYR